MKASGVIGKFAAWAVLVCACGLVSGEGDSETHWLLRCDTNADCGDARASCVCNVCTVACEPERGCGDGPAGSSCVATEAVEGCGTSPSVTTACLIECSEDLECPEGHGCRSGACERNAAPPPANEPDPPGDCDPEGDGSRPGSHAPAPDDTYLPDCENPLAREYWRVFATSDGSAYVMPRPDGAPQLSEPCSTAHALSDIVERYGLCEPASTQEEVERVNRMAPADALALTSFLHTNLVFENGGNPDEGITPFPFLDDVAAACDLRPVENSELRATCARAENQLTSGTDIGFSYSGVVAAELAGRLNQLYGIGPECGDALPLRVCIDCGPAGGCTAEIQCTSTCADAAACASPRSFCQANVCAPVPACF